MKNSLPPLWISCIPLIVLVLLISLVVALFGDDALSGASQIALLLAASICVTLGLMTKSLTFKSFEESLTDKISSVSIALVILLLIGALSGTWMVSGIVPTLIYYGMFILQPAWFLVASCIICAVVSVMTGSSWTTVATIGIALMGIGQALGFSVGWTAGAIISGAYFGDKMSPLSDTTVMASSTVGVPLFTHIRYMMGTTWPTFSIALIVYLLIGIIQGAEGESDVAVVKEGLINTFCISPWLLIVPLITGIMIYKKLPSIAILFISVIMACIAALIAQPERLFEIAGTGERTIKSIVMGLLTMMYGDTNIETGNEMLNSLVSTSGMAGMISTIWLIVSAMIFGAAMSASKMLDSIVYSMLRWPSRPITMVGSTAVVGIFLNLIMCDQYLSIIIASSMYKDAYIKNGYEPKLLSRTIEDSATVTSPIIPWTTCGMTQANVLGVSTLAYAPYCIFNYLSPVVTILMSLRIKQNKQQ